MLVMVIDDATDQSPIIVEVSGSSTCTSAMSTKLHRQQLSQLNEGWLLKFVLS
jgi:hypothetical protein